jgi:hypothetical protein
MTEEQPTEPVPPYASFTTIQNLIVRMEKHGVPRRVDPSYLVGMAGGTQNQVTHALKSMGLIDEDRVVNPALSKLVKHPEERPRLVGDILRERYPRLVGLGLNATRGDLDTALHAYGLNGATARKAASFFIAAAKYAELPLSPHFPTSRPGSGGGGGTSGTRKRSAAKRKVTTDRKDGEVEAHSSSSEFSTEVKIGAGRVSLVVDVNPIKLRGRDREFVYGLIDAIEEYAAAHSAATDTERAEESGT